MSEHGDGAATLEVGFAIDFGDSFGGLKTLDDMIGKTAADAVRDFKRIEAATGTIIRPGTAVAAFETIGNAGTRTARDIARETKSAETAGEKWVSQIKRQAETFGMSASQARAYRAELAAVRAEGTGLTELAGRIRTVSAEMTRLEQSGARAGTSVGGTRAAMQGMSYQAQDAFTQISMGTNVLSVLAIQGGQAAGQMTSLGGAAGAVARFMIGPWGLALTAGALVLGALWESHKKETEEAEKHKKALGDGAIAADGLGGATKSLTSAINLLNAAQLNDKTGAIATAARSAAAARIEQANATVAAAKAQGMLALATAKSDLAAAEKRKAQFGNDDMRSPFARLSGVAAGSTAADRENRRIYDTGVTMAAAQVNKVEADFKRLDAAYGSFRTRVVAQAIASDGQIRDSHLRLLTASTGLERAQAQHDAAVRKARIAVDAGTMSETKYAAIVKSADAALRGVEASARAAGEARRDSATAAGRAERQAHTEATKAAAEHLKIEKEVMAFAGRSAKEITIDPPGEAERRAFEQAKSTFKSVFGDVGDPMGDASKAMYDGWKTDWDEQAKASQELNDTLRLTASLAGEAGNALGRAFGQAGGAVGDMVAILGQYQAAQSEIDRNAKSESDRQRATAALQMDSLLGLTGAAKSLFAEHSAGYQAMAVAEKALAAWRAIQTVRDVAAGAAKMFASLGPWAFPAVAAMVAVMAGFGIAGGSGGSTYKPTSSDDLQKAAGTGTLLGSGTDKSASFARSLDTVAKNTAGDLLFASEMVTTLKSIDSSIGAMATTVARQISVSGSYADTSKLNLGLSGSSGFVGLFASSTTRSLYDAGITLAATTVGEIVANGIAGQTYQIVEQVKKSSGFLGIGGGTKTTYSTASGALPSDVTASVQSVIGALESGIVAAAGAIGVTGAKAMLDGFEVNIGKLSFNGLDAKGIQDQLNAVFSAVGDRMTAAVLPGVAKFQRVGEGLFETLERVASTVVAVDAGFKKLGRTTTTMGVDIDMGVASRFDSVSDLVAATDRYFTTFYSAAGQSAVKAAQLGTVLQSMGLTIPDTLASYRALVEAQDLSTAAGQSAYATLLQLSPAFVELKQAMDGAKSSADVMAEREDLERQMLELRGDTAAIRALDLAKLDASNRGLQQQVWAVQDAQKAADAAKELRDAWTSVGDTIETEIRRVRGLSGVTAGGSFAALQGQFNAATAGARGGDLELAKSLPGLSQALLTAAGNQATSRQELDRVQAMTAASLEATKALMDAMTSAPSANSTAALLAAAGNAQAGTTPTAANDDMAAELRALREELAGMRKETQAGLNAVASGTGKAARVLENVTGQLGGDRVAVTLIA